MKKITLTLISMLLMTMVVIAQTPQAFKYQAVARTSSGNLIQNQLVAFRISILQGGPSGTLLYQERHTTNTNNYGLANLDIGSGVVLFGTFSSINWSLGQMYIKVELDPLGGTAYQNMGTTQLLSVPYALYSKTSGDGGLSLPYTGTTSNGDYAFSVINSLNSAIRGKATASNGATFGVYGESASPNGSGIYGVAPSIGIKGDATSSSGNTYGVYGAAMSPSGSGIFGGNTSATGDAIGVYGLSNSSAGRGVYGEGYYGMYGFSLISGGRGVYGSAVAGATYGVYGRSSAAAGYGVYGAASSESGTTYGVYGSTASPTGFGVFGSGPVTGIKGEGTNGSGESYGVYGESASTTGCGVYGKASDYDGPNTGVYGLTSSTNGVGVHGYTSLSNSTSVGVLGETNAQSGKGIYGKAISLSGTNYGVYGEVTSSSGYSGYFTGGRFYASGNVGIGTEAPDCQLVIQAPDNQSRNMLLIKNGSGNERIQMRQNSNGSGGIWLYNGSDVNTIFLYGDGTSFINSGNLGIGTASPTELLDVSGNGRFRAIGSGAYSGPVNRTSNGTLTTATSDIRLKENIHTLQNSLDKVMHLRGVSFSWKTDPGMGTRIGFIAQEFEQVIPELVFTNETDGFKGINYAEVSAVLVEATKELNTKIDRLVNENEQLKAENEKINARLDKIEAVTSLSAAK
jgi:hypothetical protein